MSKRDTELTVIESCLKQLTTLSIASQKRVVEYLVQRVEEEKPQPRDAQPLTETATVAIAEPGGS